MATAVVPLKSYATPELVAELMDLPDPKDPDSTLMFSNVSHPTRNQVIRWLNTNADIIDRTVKRSWRVNYEFGKTYDIGTYWQDEDSLWRDEYYKAGGNVIQLRRDVCPWDPNPIYVEGHEGDPTYMIYPGDKLEVRMFQGGWKDISGGENDMYLTVDTFSIDYTAGRLLIRSMWGGYTPKYDSVRITYRYGRIPPVGAGEYMVQGQVPDAISTMCALMTAKDILNTQFWVIKVGMGGDIAGIKESMIRNFDAKIAEIRASYQRLGPVHSMITR